MDTRQNVEYKMVSEFISKTGANPDDALACLKTWGWDMKRALTDYNDTCAVDLIDLIDEDDDNSKESVVVLRNNSSSLNNKYKQQQQQQQQQQYQEINKTIAPVLCKQDSIDLTECKKLFRGISRATDNVGIVSRARHEIAKDFYKSLKRNDNTNNFQYLVDTPDSTFILPNIYNYPEDFRIFIEKDLIEMSTLNALEQSQRLNWWADSNVCRKLWPLATTGDGNCLLHAASLGIWGFHDRKLTLRTALYSVLSDGKFKDELRRRWRFQQTQFNKRAGFVYSESEWSKEWDDIISMASPEPRKSINNHNYNNPTTTPATTTTTRNNDDYRRRISFLGRNSITENEVLDNNLSTSSSSTTTASTTAAVYESLEEIHILALAHVLRRAIIVISDTVLKDLHGEAMAPITFGGIYLPFEIEPKECNRGPLLLAYDMAHFSALVPMENGSDYPPSLVPLTDYENILLPIQFCIDPGEDFDWKLYNGNEDNWSLTEREHIALLKEYLDVVYVATNRSPDDEICEDIEDEFEKKFIESEIIIPTTADYITTNTSEEANNNNNCNGKSKASRQLHSVAKQFGSIGKNMSRKLKKNIGSIAKLGGKNFQKKNSFTGMGGTSLSPPYICSRILCARLRLKRHEYQEEMIRNYLECAQNRFIEAEKNKEQKLLSSTGNITGTTIQQQQQPTVVAINTGINTLNKDECSNNGSSRSNNRNKLDSLSITQNDNNMSILQQQQQQQQEFNEHSYCINAGCNQLATFETSYLCPECFEKQKKHENLQYFNSSPRYGTGNSKFYTQADIQSHDSIRKLPSLKKLNELDQTLYLSNSTFYNDVLPSYDEVEHLNNRESHRKYTTSVNSSSHQPLSASSSSSSSSTTTPSPSQSQSSNGSSNNAINNKKSLITENNSLLSPVSITKIHIGNDDDNERNRKNNLHQHLHLQQQQQQSHNHQLIVTGITSQSPIPITKPCKTLGCPFYGNSSTNFLCSKCLKATTGSTITTRNQHDYDYYQHHKNHNHNHSSHHNELSFKSNPIYTAPSPSPPPPSTSATSTTTLYKSESKITSDI